MKFSLFGALRLSPLLVVAALPLVLLAFRPSATPSPVPPRADPMQSAGSMATAVPAWTEREPALALAAGSARSRADRELEHALRVRPVQATAVRDWREGERVVLPLFEGRTLAGVVRLLRPRADGGLWVGGQLDEGGSFTFAAGPGEERADAGLVLPREGSTVYRLSRGDDGGALLAELPRDAVLCATLPRPPPAQARAAALTENSVGPGAAAAAAPVPAPRLESRPEAEPVLFLDFDGETVLDPVWNGGAPIAAAPSGLSAAEIMRVWRMVAEDYRSFRVNVTTLPERYAAARPGQRMRVVLTPTRDWYGQVGGVALIFSWRDAGAGAFAEDVPCWVFTEPGVMLPEDVALAASHEAGHTFGLYHDGLRDENGTTPPSGDYFAGHGTGETAWGPIMGAPFGKPLIQWSRGDYAVGGKIANNPQDDLAIIATIENHVGYVGERRAASLAEAGRLRVLADGVTVDHVGQIERGGAESWWLVALGAGAVDLRLAPTEDEAVNASNFDGALVLATPGGGVVASADAVGTRFPRLTATVAAGVYVLRVRSVGEGSPHAGGYSDYGSIGRFRVRGQVPAPAAVAPLVGGSARALGRAGEELIYQIEAAGAGLAFAAEGLPPGLTVGADGVVRGVPESCGVWRATLRVANAQGGAERAVEFVVAGASLAEAVDAPDLELTSGGERPWMSVAEASAPRGGSLARSGELLDNLGESWMETRLRGPGTLRWRWRSSTEPGYDVLHATLDGAVVAAISGETPWAERVLELPAGEHRVRWSYDKDDYLSENLDTVWVDDLRWERGFERWAAAAGLSGEAAAPRADPDRDGVVNLLEYAFGRDGAVADGLGEAIGAGSGANGAAGVASGEGGGAALVLEFFRPSGRTDLRYVAEVSEDLVHWAGGHAYGEGVVNGANLPTEELERRVVDGGERIRLRDTTNPGLGAPRRFIRVRVERN